MVEKMALVFSSLSILLMKNKEIKYTYGKQGNLVQVKKQSGK